MAPRTRFLLVPQHRHGLDAVPTIGHTESMTVKVGISLPDATHARALEHARSAGTTLSGLVDTALKAELTRRELAEHVVMLAEADDVDRLRARARSRSRALSEWKNGR
jgi:hypothetical protein